MDDIFLPDYLINNNFLLDLQRFGSADAEGRTERATEQKRKKAREEGRVALSKDIPGAFITLATFLTIFFMAGYFFDVIVQNFRYVMININEIDFVNDSEFFKRQFMMPLLKVFIPLGSVAFIIAVASNYFQIGFQFSSKAIKPDFKKVNPNIFAFFKKQVFSMQGLFNLIKSLFKVGVIGIITYLTISGKVKNITQLIHVQNLFVSFTFIVSLIFEIVMKVLLLLLVFSIADYLFVKFQFEESVKMKKEEVKQEFKDTFGDPMIKSKLKQMYQEMLNDKKMLNEVPKADVVITNPTHFAVALKRDIGTGGTPKIIAKGADNFAQKIKEIARENDVFMYENVPLARKLYSECEVEDYIPNELIGAVVVAYKMSYLYRKSKGKEVSFI